ncbi:MAG: cell division protein ZipA [Colwellia sp.]|nr:cell division protein ZipA [Colwellia sp.]
MEDNFRNALIIISGVVIAAIFIHGLWTIRKQKNPYKLKTNKNQVKPLSRDFDGKGFDQDGVGQIKVLKQDNGSDVNSEEYIEQTLKVEDISHLEPELSDNTHSDFNLQNQMREQEYDVAIDNFQDELETAKTLESVTLEPIYQQPITQPKIQPKVQPKVQLKAQAQAEAGAKKVEKTSAIKKVNKAKSIQTEINQDEIEVNFGNGIVMDENDQHQEPSLDNEQVIVKEKRSDIEPQIIILSVVMPANQLMSGTALLPSLLTLGMKYGEMDIFHRHQDSAGNGGISFSLANMLNPGSFDLNNMETFATQGVSLFMALPNAVDPYIAFEQMLAAAKQLADEFNAKLLDNKRNVMTKQTEQHYISKIREFDRQYRLASGDT